MSFFLNLLALGSLAAMCYALWHPEKMFPFRNPTWIRAVGFYFTLAVIFFLLASSLSPDRSAETADGQSAPEALLEEKATPSPTGPLTWKEIERKSIAMPATGRDRLQVAIVPVEDQARAGQKELLATAAAVAVKMQKDSGVPVVAVTLLCQEEGNDLARPALAHAVYIPDGKGLDGKAEGSGQWETLRAAKRGYTETELAYLKAYGELHNDFHSATGFKEKELDAAVSSLLNIRPGSVHPFDNGLENATR